MDSWGGGALKSYMMAPPLSVIKIVKYCVILVGGGGSLGDVKILQMIMAPPPLSVIKIVKYCGVWGGGGAKTVQKIVARPPPLTVIKIVKYCGVRGGGGIGREGRERQNPTKLIASLISVIMIVKYFGIVGGGHWGALKSYKMIMAPPVSVIKIVKYCGQKYHAYKQYNCILPVTNWRVWVIKYFL